VKKKKRKRQAKWLNQRLKELNACKCGRRPVVRATRKHGLKRMWRECVSRDDIKWLACQIPFDKVRRCAYHYTAVKWKRIAHLPWRDIRKAIEREVSL